jgi:two-component system, OmpR family, sensor kinase
MTQAGQRNKFWRSVRQLPDRVPLRTKLITAVLVLVAVALAVISIAGLSLLRSYLDAQADTELQDQVVSQPLRNYLFQYESNGPQIVRGGQVSVEWLSGGRVTQLVQSSQGLGSSNQVIPGPAISPGAKWLSAYGQPTTVAASHGGGHWRVVAYPLSVGNPFSSRVTSGTIIFGVDFSSAYATLTRLTAVDLVVSLVLLALVAIAGVTVIRASLRPLREIEETAGAIAAGDLTQRVPERDPRTEVGRLGRSLNVMLGQIETAFRMRSESAREARRSEQRMRQFVADASHELRTPLTAIRGFAEYYRQRGANLSQESAPNGNGHLGRADLDRIMRRVEQESARMGVLVEDMLLLARLDQQRPLEHHPVDLLTLAADAVHDARVVAPERSINLTVSSDAALILLGDEVRLRQVIGNLMSNALTHTPDGTPIEVRLRSGTLGRPRAGGYTAVGADPLDAVRVPAAVLEVADAGPGLTAEQAEHAFERFYRADRARSTGGTGLGLAIVAALVAAHGGTVWVDSEPDQGATFGIALPLAPEAVPDSDASDYESDVTDEPVPADRPQPTGLTEPGSPTTRPPGP